MTAAFYQRHKHTLKYLPLLLLCGYLAVVRILLIFSYSIDLDGAEYINVHIVQRLLNGNPLYSDPTLFPFMTCLYTPLYFYLYYGCAELFQLDYLNNLHGLFITGRTISFLFFILLVSVLFRAARKYQVPLFYRMILLTLLMLLLTGGFYVVKMDALKIFFFTLFLIYLIKYSYSGKNLKDGIPACLFALTAFSIKQDALLYILMSGVLLFLLRRSGKTILLFTAFLAGACILFYGLSVFYGAAFFKNTILFNLQVSTDLNKESMSLLIILFSFVRLFPLLFISLLNIIFLYRKKSTDSPEMYLSVLGIIFFLMAHLSMLRPGAYLNYSFEAIIVLLFSIAIYVKINNTLIPVKNTLQGVLLTGYILYLFCSNILIHSYAYHQEKEAASKKLYFSYLQERKDIISETDSTVVFFPNPGMVIFFPDNRVIYGYDYHANQYINLITGMHLQTRLLLYNSTEYDTYFLTKNTTYLVLPDKPASKQHILTYYPDYTLQRSTGHFLLYSYR